MNGKVRKRRAPKRSFQIVTDFGEYFPFDARHIDRIPTELRGVYILYDYRKFPVYVGEAGARGGGRITGRLRKHLHSKRFHEVIKTFSVYGMEQEYIRDIEAILLRSVKPTLIFNKKKEGYYKAKRLKKFKGRPPSRSKRARK